MANIEKFTLKDDRNNWFIVLEIDRDTLTPKRATEINNFWTSAGDRLREADGDAVKAVVKQAAERFVYAILEFGGGVCSDNHVAASWTHEHLHTCEGWGRNEENSPFGWCGIRLVEADVLIDLNIEIEAC